jgi:signal transduction histidine kinase
VSARLNMPQLRLRVASAIVSLLVAFVTGGLLVEHWALNFDLATISTHVSWDIAIYGLYMLIGLGWAWRRLTPVDQRRRDQDETDDEQGGGPENQAGRADTPDDASQMASHLLRFPFKLVRWGLMGFVLAVVIRALVNIYLLGLSPLLSVGVAISAVPVGLAILALLYVLLKGWIHPILAALGRESLPAGARLSVVGKLTVVLLSVSMATTIPLALIHIGRSASLSQTIERQNEQRLLKLVVHGSVHLDRYQLSETLAGISLGQAKLKLTDKPRPDAVRLSKRHGASYVSVDTPEDFRGSQLFVLVLAVFVISLAIFVGRDLGQSVGRDVRLVSARVQQLLDQRDGGLTGEQPAIIVGTPQITELKQLADAVNRLLARIAELNIGSFLAIEKILDADRVKTQFLASMSHDLRSPLNSVLGFSELLSRGLEGELSPDQKKAVATIQRNASELLWLINQVLDFAKVEAGRFALHKEEALPANVLTDALKTCRDRGMPAAVAIKTELQAGLSPFLLDGPRIAEIIVHLVRFCSRQAGTSTITISVSTRKVVDEQRIELGANRQLEIRVEDDSVGINDELRDKLFDGFYRVSGHRGLNLGLALSRAIAELHQGELTVEISEQGNCFTASIPIFEKLAIGRLRKVKV